MELLRRAVGLGADERCRMLEEVVRLNMDVAETIGLRFRNRGIPDDDLVQVAYVGLVLSVERYDPAYGRDFLSFAVPTIRGEVRRYFRDHGWTVRPPRRIQDLQARISTEREALAQELGRQPRPSELANWLEEDLEEVLQALAANGCFTPSSLDAPVGRHESAALGDLLTCQDEDRLAVEARVMLAPAVRRLPERDQRILFLRFFEERTQQEIGEELGVTQMQVSRLLTRILRDLRQDLVSRPGAPAQGSGCDRRPTGH